MGEHGAVCAWRCALQRCGDLRMARREDRGGEQRRIGGAGAADRKGRHRHAGRHLHDRQQRIEAVECARLHRHAEHRQQRLGRGHAGQMRRAAGAGDQHFQAARRGAGWRIRTADRACGGPRRRASRRAMPSLSSISAAALIVSQSDDDPMMMPTRAFIARILASRRCARPRQAAQAPARSAAGSSSRISRPMYWRWRASAARLRSRCASSSASSNARADRAAAAAPASAASSARRAAAAHGLALAALRLGRWRSAARAAVGRRRLDVGAQRAAGRRCEALSTCQQGSDPDARAQRCYNRCASWHRQRMPQQVDASRISELKQVVAGALAEAAATGRQPGRGRRQPAARPDRHRAAGRGRDHRVPPRPRPVADRVLRQIQGLGQHGRSAARGGARDGAQGRRDRAPHRGR